jgi:hypothetical protein
MSQRHRIFSFINCYLLTLQKSIARAENVKKNQINVENRQDMDKEISEETQLNRSKESKVCMRSLTPMFCKNSGSLFKKC